MKILLTILALVAQASFLPSADSPASTDPAHDTQQKSWLAYATPGEPHTHLSQYVGKWKHQVKWWMSPDSEPQI